MTQVDCNPCTYDSWTEPIVNSQKFKLLVFSYLLFYFLTTKVRWITVTVTVCGF